MSFQSKLAPSFVVAVPLLVLAALSGCGGSSGQSAQEEAAVRAVMADLQSSARRGDSGHICNKIFTPKLADSVAHASKTGSCAKEVKKKLFIPRETVTVKSVEVTDPASAKAVIDEQTGRSSNVFLVKQSGKWRVRGIRPA